MTIGFPDSFCASLPGLEYSEPWGPEHPCWKLDGKIFALVNPVAGTVSAKTPDIETAEVLIQAGAAGVARFLHRSWVAVPIASTQDEVTHRIRESYRIIRASLPKRRQRELPQPD